MDNHLSYKKHQTKFWKLLLNGLAVTTRGNLENSRCLCQKGHGHIHTDIDNNFCVKPTYFTRLSLRKVKEIGLIATTRFEDLDLNCGVG